MSLETQVVEQMKVAMKAKDKVALETLRSVKSAILMAKTASGAGDELSEEEEIKLVQKLSKQRKEAATIYHEQGRADLAADEEAQAEILAQFLPKQMSEAELEAELKALIDEMGAEGMKDMGKVMGAASAKFAGKADGKVMSGMVRKLLS